MHHSDYRKIHYFNEIEITQMMKDYHFNDEDMQILIALRPMVQEHIPQLLSGFYEFIFSFEHAKTFIHNDTLMQKHQEGIKTWFLSLFSGNYDKNYFHNLGIISETHVKIGLPSHYVNTAFSYIRQFLVKLFLHTDNTNALSSMHKIIDINLDILSLTYKEEEQQQLLKDIVLIKEVIKNKTVIPYLQPIIHTQKNHSPKYECLMRLKDPETGALHSIISLPSYCKNHFIV